MYDFESGILAIDGKEAPIKEFRVCFTCPWGIFSTLEEAKERCEQLDMDPTLVIQPVVVIFDEAGRSEIFIRR